MERGELGEAKCNLIRHADCRWVNDSNCQAAFLSSGDVGWQWRIQELKMGLSMRRSSACGWMRRSRWEVRRRDLLLSGNDVFDAVQSAPACHCIQCGLETHLEMERQTLLILAMGRWPLLPSLMRHSLLDIIWKVCLGVRRQNCIVVCYVCIYFLAERLLYRYVTFGLWHELSVCRLSVVCDVVAPCTDLNCSAIFCTG